MQLLSLITIPTPWHPATAKQTCASTVLYASCMHSLTSSPRSGHSVQCLYPKNIRVFPDKPNCDFVKAVCSDSSCPVCVCDTQHTHIIIHLCPSITHVFLKPLLMSCGGTYKFMSSVHKVFFDHMRVLYSMFIHTDYKRWSSVN